MYCMQPGQTSITKTHCHCIYAYIGQSFLQNDDFYFWYPLEISPKNQKVVLLVK